MSTQNTAFYLKKKAVRFDFCADKISSDGGMLLLHKLCRKTKLISSFCEHVPDDRDQLRITHELQELVLQRVLLLSCGYEDGNDLDYLKDDPMLEVLLKQGSCSQPTMSRLENSMNMSDLYRLAEWWIDRYVASLEGRKHVIIDVDCTADPTYGNQQGSLFNGYYHQYQLNELFYIDGETGQIILPVLRPGNVHTNKWNERFLNKIAIKIRAKYPTMQIIVRADAGFSNSRFYEEVEKDDLDFCVGLTSNERLKKFITDSYNEVKEQYGDKGIEHQRFEGPFLYKADTWDKEYEAYAKIESTGKGMNVRFFISNFADEKPEQLYKDFYVQRGEASENRIKEIKNMCFSDRLSCERFSANYFRLMLSCLAYELLNIIRQLIRKTKTKSKKAKNWTMNSIRLYLLKIGTQVKICKRSIQLSFCSAFRYKQLFTSIIMRC